MEISEEHARSDVQEHLNFKKFDKSKRGWSHMTVALLLNIFRL